MKLFFTSLFFLVGLLAFGQCPAGATLIEFHNGASTPSGWVVDDQRTDYWLVTDDSGSGPSGEVVITSAFDVSAYSSITVNVDVATFGSGTASPADIEFSLDGGANFDPNIFTTNTPSSSSYIDGGDFTFNVPSSTTQLVIRISKNGSGARDVRVRNFNICGSTTVACGLILSNPQVSCDANTSGTDTYTYSVDFSGGGTETYTTTPSVGVLGGDDPSSTATGTITVSTIDEGTDGTLMISSTNCGLSETIISPTCNPPAPLVITEIMYNTPTPGDDDEWIEICNTSASSFDMTGFSIAINATSEFTFPSYSIVANDCIIIAIGTNGDLSYNSTAGCRFIPTDGVDIGTSNTNNMFNSSATITLYEADGTTIADQVTYDDADGADGDGSSLHIIDITMDNSNTGSNWTTVPNGGSPFANTATPTCPPCDAPTKVVIAPGNMTTFLTASEGCDASNGYTYYSTDGTEDFMFAINWAPDGSLSAANEAAKSSISISITTNAPGTAVDNGLAQGTWTMERYWNASVGGNSLDETVDMKFFYVPSEKSGTDNEATNSGFSPIETAVWFKTVGQDFDPTMITSGSVGQGAIPLTVLSDGNTENGVTYVEFTGVSSFSGGTYAAGAGEVSTNVLPVSLESFTAKPLGPMVQLSWSTAQELNNEMFYIEKSFDGRTFETIGYRKGQGSVGTQTNYVFQDREPGASKLYYRLLQEDYDGITTYSPVVFVEVNESNDIKVFPTIVDQELNYVVPDRYAKLTLTNLVGSIYQQHYISERGSIDFSELPAGIYQVHIYSEYGELFERVVKL